MSLEYIRRQWERTEAISSKLSKANRQIELGKTGRTIINIDSADLLVLEWALASYKKELQSEYNREIFMQIEDMKKKNEKSV